MINAGTLGAARQPGAPQGGPAMNAEAIRTLYEYHFALNRRTWDECVTRLSDEQFVAEVGYSLGSIRNQVVHVMSVDQRWFALLRGAPLPDRLQPAQFPDRASVRTRRDEIDSAMRKQLADLADADAARVLTYAHPRTGATFSNPAWHILFHVVNHGTDHRAQILAMLHGLGAPTLEQDLMGYLWASGVR
jgi:uncharacterized damage-inducible protein DinB